MYKIILRVARHILSSKLLFSCYIINIDLPALFFIHSKIVSEFTELDLDTILRVSNGVLLKNALKYFGGTDKLPMGFILLMTL